MTERDLGVEPHLTAAFALTSNPNAYALLVGAGVSVSSGVPSAWDVQSALIARLAKTHGEEPGDPFSWFAEKFGKQSTYDELLGSLTHTQGERQALLRSFFEPTEEEREAGLKKPSPAHRAIARLVAAGLVRVILTINFDRLIETALRDEGIEPTVVASPSDIAGLAPIHTQRCVVIHIHGDYLNPTAMLNTAEELGTYPRTVDRLLNKVLSEHGLICAGWSATWDPALRKAVSRNAKRFYATYWVEPYSLSDCANGLCAQRQAILVHAKADDFFGAVADACDAIHDTGRRHPLTAPIAAATAKRSLAGAHVAISLHDVLHKELERLRSVEVLTTTKFDDADVAAEHAKRQGQIDSALEVPLTLVATCAYWGTPAVDDWWFDDISRFGVQPLVGGSTALIHQRKFPATALLYASGIASVAARRFDLTRRLLTEPTTVDQYSGQRITIATYLTPDHTLKLGRSHLYVHNLLRPIFEDFVGLGAAAYGAASERFEYLRLVQVTFQGLKADGRDSEGATDESELRRLLERAKDPAADVAAKAKNELTAADQATKERRRERGGYVPRAFVHLFVTGRMDSHRAVTAAELDAEVIRDGDRHPLVRAGLCDGRPDILRSTMADVDVAIEDLANKTAWSFGSGWIPSEFYLDQTSK